MGIWYHIERKAKRTADYKRQQADNERRERIRREDEQRERLRATAPERKKERERLKNERNREQRAAYYAGKRRENPEKYRIYGREWREQNPEKARAGAHRRRARIKSTGGTLTPNEIKHQRQLQGGVCYWCRKKITGTPHIDHVIPISRNGRNDRGNIVIACASCNLSKRAKMPEEFAGRFL